MGNMDNRQSLNYAINKKNDIKWNFWISQKKFAEQTRFCTQSGTDGQTDGQDETSITPFKDVEAGGIITKTSLKIIR